MNILLISSFLPYPLFSGGHIRLFNLIKELAKRHTITLVCEKRDYQGERDIKELRKICKQIIVYEKRAQWSMQNIIKTGLSPYPFLMVGHMQKEMKKKIQTLLTEEKFDLIHIETFYVMQNVPQTNIPTVLVEHNIEHLVYEKFARSTPLFLRPILLIDVAKMEYWEEKFWKMATRLVAVSKDEKALMMREDVVVVPNGVDIEKFKVQSSKFKVQTKEKKILFIGDFRWVQNRNAVEWTLKDIWPKIIGKWKLENGKLILWIVGRQIPGWIKYIVNDENVIFDEDAPKETEAIFKKADILLAPIRIGGGTSFKILEAMASGTPVVTTRLGIEGITARKGKEVLIADTAQGLADNVIDLLENDALYKNIAQSARKLVEEKYDWRIIVKSLENVYESVLL